MSDQRQWKNINRVFKLSESSDKYCWSDLYAVGAEHVTGRRVEPIVAEELKEAARSTTRCLADAKENGSCYCGKFQEASHETVT